MFIIPIAAIGVLGLAPDAEHDTRISTDAEGNTIIQRIPRTADSGSSWPPAVTLAVQALQQLAGVSQTLAGAIGSGDASRIAAASPTLEPAIGLVRQQLGMLPRPAVEDQPQMSWES